MCRIQHIKNLIGGLCEAALGVRDHVPRTKMDGVKMAGGAPLRGRRVCSLPFVR